jgi:hypothetical protein
VRALKRLARLSTYPPPLLLLAIAQDFGKLRLMWKRGRSQANARKVKKQYRHIALTVHPDKLMKPCQKKKVTDMMRDILNEADRMKDELTK